MPGKDTKKQKYDVAVIGGGPAGIMSAFVAAEFGAKVVLIEKNKQLGRKLLLTGNGRCNLTNAEFNLKNLVSNYHNGEFLFHAFSIFGPEQTIKFFERLGIKTKIENNKRVFPASGRAEGILESLEDCLKKNKVKVVFNSEIKEISKTGKKISKLVLGDDEIVAKRYILATGGKSYPLTGSDGSGYKLAEKLGHTIAKLLPALAPIKLKEKWAETLQAIGLENVRLTVVSGGKKILFEDGEILFTHFGISGPTVLNISGKVGELLLLGDVKIELDLFPNLNHEESGKEFEDILRRYPNRTVKNVLSFLVPERMAEVLANIAKIDKDKIANNMSKAERIAIVKILKNIELTPEEILSFEQAMVTRGGVSLKEIDHKTMKSKIIDNLYFAGEIIDVDAKTGGFNLQMCWSTGYLAGKSSAE